MTAKKHCPLCGGTGILRSFMYSKKYQRDIEVARPCECRLRERVIEWLSPLTRHYANTWAKENVSALNRELVEQVRVDHHIWVDGNKNFCLLLFVEALKNHLREVGPDHGFLDYLVISDTELHELHWAEETSIEVPKWHQNQLVIIRLGDHQYASKGHLSRVIASRIAMLHGIGVKVWVAYYGDQPWTRTTSDKHFWWSEELEETREVLGFNKIMLGGAAGTRGAQGLGATGTSIMDEIDDEDLPEA